MPDRDHGRRAVATLLTEPAQHLDRPSPTRDRQRSALARPIDQQKRTEEDGAEDDGWPLRSYLQLGALPGAVPCARLHTKLVLWEWGLDRLVETAELLVSEIITNAVQAPQVRQQLPKLPRQNVVAEPIGRDTCAAVTLGAAVVPEDRRA